MSITLTQAAKIALSLEVAGAIDRQGKRTYATAVSVDGRMVRDEQLIRLANGTSVMKVADVWIAGDVTPLPGQGDRITGLGLTGIVLLRSDAKKLNGELDHVTLQLRQE